MPQKITKEYLLKCTLKIILKLNYPGMFRGKLLYFFSKKILVFFGQFSNEHK